jgi:probable F420-dependent oxidoreductase
VNVELGISIFVTDEMPSPADIGRLVEERGFGSLFVAEHTHMPRDSVRDVDRKYYRALDPFVTLTAAAAATTTLRVGFGIMLLPQRDPITTAKAIASLDVVSGGRVEVGLGAGWNVPEIENHGTPFDQRFGVLRERVEAMKAIWTEDEAEYHGRYVDFDPIWSWPKPVQKPHPPILVGGNGAKVLDRVLAFGDEWMPNSIGDEEKFFARIAELRERARAAGRDSIPVTFSGAPPKPDVIERLANAGIHRCVSYVPPAPEGEIERHIDRRAALVEEAEQLTG